MILRAAGFMTRALASAVIALAECGPDTQTGLTDGAIAQLGERLHGMQEVSGSIPLGSTSLR